MNWMLTTFQDPKSMSMVLLTKTFNYITSIMITIFCASLSMSVLNLKNNLMFKKMKDHNMMEIAWTIIPMMAILSMIINSTKTLYMNSEMKLNIINIKISGNQWFWTYEYPMQKTFDSYMMIKSPFHFTFLETNNALIIPTNKQTQLLISSNDVLHSWTIPSMNIKMDAIPYQINSLQLKPLTSSIMFGQCSEICGMNHSFMPIKIESIPINKFAKWIFFGNLNKVLIF